jgi:hypothetical protein
MSQQPPLDPAEHAKQFASTWADKLEEYCALRMAEIGVPQDMTGEPDFDGDGRWLVFNPYRGNGGGNTVGIIVDSGVLNPDLLKGKKGGRLWPHARLRDRIDVVIAHEHEELRRGSHAAAIKAAPNTELRISAQARRMSRAMAR